MKKLSERVIGCSLEVSKSLKSGFLEKVYANALALEMREACIAYERERPITVRYRGEAVGEYLADFLIEGKLILEIKAVGSLLKEHEWQVLNYLNATGLNVGLLLNFGASRLQIKRVVHEYREADNL